MMVDLGTLPGDSQSTANQSNSQGQIVGNSDSASGDIHAVLYSGGNMIALPTLGGTNSYAVGINSHGDVVGDGQTAADTKASSYHAFLYTGGPLTNLGTLPGAAESRGYSINDSRLIVGYSGPALSKPSTSLAHTGSQRIPPRPTPDSSPAMARPAVFARPAVQTGTAFLYFQGTMVNLKTLLPTSSGWTLESANFINNNGQICGYGIIGGQEHAFLLTPQ